MGYEIDSPMFLALFFTAGFLIIFVGMFVTVIKEARDWNETCVQKGLIDMCSPEDVCEKDCQALGKTFFKYEDAMFSDDNCWCVENGNTRQIW